MVVIFNQTSSNLTYFVNIYRNRTIIIAFYTFS